ncbi:hypothetical protein GCK72_005255 [Caenorhabditis remanei]|uniref:Uncharacterized protein n=1 Tax=Caenorhabditis remanei TaxID=31234 RepID=A0A6A5HG05_CAERE|nr:hypothetical protein GCK72_005255 [Caenorhabditis remanei]KAF1765303.1 hypothetical protein GCK72_005255 [Caenorhabditis remanei]
MKIFAFLLISFVLPLRSEANFKAGKNRICMITVYSTCILFVFSLVIFISSLLSFFKNRKLHKFQLSDPQANIYYKDKEKTPKLKRKVLEAMDKGGSVYKKPNKKTNKTTSNSSQSSNMESQGTLCLPAPQERL